MCFIFSIKKYIEILNLFQDIPNIDILPGFQKQEYVKNHPVCLIQNMITILLKKQQLCDMNDITYLYHKASDHQGYLGIKRV